ncbi:MAG: hypothetical protein RLZZ584_4038 [Pseudomonadota bacterium]
MNPARGRQLLAGWRRVRAACTGLALVAALGGCAWLTIPPTRIPMNVLRPPGPCDGTAGTPSSGAAAAAAAADTLVVMLPGVYSRPQEFVDEGFVDALVRQGARVEVAVVDAHLGYYNDRSVLRRLRDDVIGPARARGVRQIWLVGISLGGFAALAYGARHGDEITGVVALAPYLGPRRLLQEISDAGGPQLWRTQVPAPGPDEADRAIWAHYGAGPAPLPASAVYLGYGDTDRFEDSHRLFASLLPARQVSTTPGGHDWRAWRRLWDGWLARGLLPARCTAA